MCFVLCIFQVYMEFNRIVGKNLKQEFYEGIDRHSVRLMEIFRSKRGNVGKNLADLIQQTRVSPQIHMHLRHFFSILLFVICNDIRIGLVWFNLHSPPFFNLKLQEFSTLLTPLAVNAFFEPYFLNHKVPSHSLLCD